MKLNLSTLLTILGAGAVLAPDLTGLAAWLGGLGIPWLVTVSHGLGIVALFFASAPRVVEKLRPVLASLNLATPPAPQSGVVVQPVARDTFGKGTALVLVFAALAATSCKTTPTNPDTFFNVIVECTEQNTNNPQASAAVLGCLTAAVGGDYGACLAGLVTAGHWTVDEIACVVRSYAKTSAVRINAGVPMASDSVVLKNANAWIAQERIGYR